MPLTALLSHIDRAARRQTRAAAGSIMARAIPARDARIVRWGGVTRAIPDTMAQQRVDAIVSAWDRWQGQILEAWAAVRLPELEAAREEARQSRNAVLQRVREATAASLTGLAIKARIAANMLVETDPKASALSYDADDTEGLFLDLAGDVLALTGGLPAAHRGEA